MTDNDGCVQDGVLSDPEVHGDDVPLALEFIITPYDNTGPVFTDPKYEGNEYNYITNPSLGNFLIANMACEILCIKYCSAWVGAESNSKLIYTHWGSGAPGASVLLHEYMHAKGIAHRGTVNNPASDGETNDEIYHPDKKAIMYKYYWSGSLNEMNRNERSQITSWW